MSETETPTGPVGRVVKDEAILDLSHLTEPGQLAAISRIEDVAVVIVPESLAAAYATIPTADVASTLYVPSGVNVRLQTGSLSVGGDGLGAENDVLVVIGLLLITSPVTAPVPKRIYVVGSVLAPRGSEQVLGQALAGGTGGVSYYGHADGQQVKVLSGQVKLSPAMLANAAGRPDDILVVAGEVVITGEVTSVGYGLTLIAGQLAAPAASRDVLEPAIQTQGQVTWYEGANPRVFNGDAPASAPTSFGCWPVRPRWSCWVTSPSRRPSPRPRCRRSSPASPCSATSSRRPGSSGWCSSSPPTCSATS